MRWGDGIFGGTPQELIVVNMLPTTDIDSAQQVIVRNDFNFFSTSTSTSNTLLFSLCLASCC